MHKKWKRRIDNGSYVSSLFMDLSKTFDTINHDLMLAKFNACGFSTNVINLMHSYLKNRKQKVQINNKDLLTDRYSTFCLLMICVFYSI